MFKASDLHVVACCSNPMRWKSRMKYALEFIDHMKESGVTLTIVETQIGERPFELENIPGIRWIGTRCKTMAWSKESALNVGIKSLPHDAKYVSWVDMDIEFRDRNWAVETIHALQLDPVVQPWSEALDLGPKGEVMEVKGKQVATSFGYIYRETDRVNDWWKDKPAYIYPHSGYAWAARMEFLDDVGLLLDFSGLGAADHQMSLGMIGSIDQACHGLSSPSYKAQVKAWGDRAFSACKGHVGYVPGRIEHNFHGPKHLRRYVERWDILNKHNFDPTTDLHRNRYGILELSGNKPDFSRDVVSYFSQRNEDLNYAG